MRRFIIFILIFLLAIPSVAAAKRKHPERWYQDAWCAAVGGQTEHRLPDGARVDCVTAIHAVEFDFADKWAEAIGQALLYAEDTGLEAGIVLILEDPVHDARYVARLRRAVQNICRPVRLWLVGADGVMLE